MSLDQGLRVERARPEPARAPVTGRTHPGRPRVVAVVHARDPEHLPELLKAVAAQTRAPDLLVGVDAGGDDEAGRRVAAVLGAHCDHVLRLGPGTGLADGVTAALTHLAAHDLHPSSDPRTPVADEPGTTAPPSRDWVWVLDDRDRPTMPTLERLVDRVRRSDNVAAVGTKHRGGPTGEVLLDTGFTTTRGSRRLTRLDEGEVDQGQHDATCDVLAVGLTGLLVRADVWLELGGPDPALSRPGLPGAEIDLGRRVRLAGHRVEVVPSAVLVRPPGDPVAPPALQRRSTAYLRLVGASTAAFPLVLAQVVLGALVRVLGGLAAKEPLVGLRAAGQVLAPLLRPDLLLRARARARRTRRVPGHQLHPLLADRRETWRWHRSRIVVPTPSVPRGTGRVVAVLALLVLGTLASLLASWRLLGAGAVTSAAAAPAPDGVGGVLDALTSGWQAAGAGVAAAPDPALWPLLALALPLGSAASAFLLLTLAAVPVAAVAGWWGAGVLTRSAWWRLLAGLAWAAAPALLLAVAGGRYGALLAHLALPVAARLLVHAVGARSVRAAWTWSAACALATVPVVCGAPVLVVPAVLAGLAAAVRGRRLAPALVVVPAAVLALPTLLDALRLPAVLLAGPGTPAAAAAPLPWQVLLGWPTDPSAVLPQLPPVALLVAGAAPAVAAVLALPLALAAGRAGTAVRTGLLVAAAGLVVALLQAGTVVGLDAAGEAVLGWAGPGTSLALLGVLAAGLAVGARSGVPVPVPATDPTEDGTDATPAREPRRRRVLRRTLPVVAALLCLLPLLALGGWSTTQATDPAPTDLVRSVPALPAVVVDAARSSDQVRTLVLRATPSTGTDGALPDLQAVLVRDEGPSLATTGASGAVGQAYRPLADDPARVALDTAVGGLVTARAPARDLLAPLGVGAVAVLLPPADSAAEVAATDSLAARLAAVDGLVPAGETGSARAWRVQGDPAAPDRVAALRVLPPSGTAPAAGEPAWQALASDARGAEVDLPAGADGRLLALAERADAGWRATLDGVALEPATVDGWAQGFVLPENGGRLELRHADTAVPGLLGWQLLVLVVTVLLAVPVRPEAS